jgi:hypothetical protein
MERSFKGGFTTQRVWGWTLSINMLANHRDVEVQAQKITQITELPFEFSVILRGQPIQLSHKGSHRGKATKIGVSCHKRAQKLFPVSAMTACAPIGAVEAQT